MLRSQKSLWQWTGKTSLTTDPSQLGLLSDPPKVCGPPDIRNPSPYSSTPFFTQFWSLWGKKGSRASAMMTTS